MSSRVSQSEGNRAIFAQRCTRDAQRYFDRHGYTSLPALPAPDPALEMVIVVPALAEPDVVGTLASVAAAVCEGVCLELLLVINAPDDANEQLRRVSSKSLEQARAWSQHASLTCHVLDYRDLPRDQACVGLARKLGMDIALARLAATTRARGVIVSLDADCRVAPNYPVAIAEYFARNPQALAATIAFEHPLTQTEQAAHAAIVDYELHLRCYKNGLQHAGSAYARYTVGSAFAVRSEVYAQEGGMNRRAAGEDFYFINKLQKRGDVGEINTTVVYPSPRTSTRVPFGTGAAMLRSQSAAVTTYAPEVYLRLQLFQDELKNHVGNAGKMSSDYAAFLASMGFTNWLRKTRANVASTDTLLKQLNRWLDGFRTMKFINACSETHNPRVPVADAAREILRWRGLPSDGEPRTLLERFRELDRHTNAGA